MRGILIALFCIIFVIGINGAALKPPSSIDDDAVELTTLFEKCWSLKPATVQKMKPFAYCQIIDKCCGDEHRSQAITLFVPALQDHSSEAHFMEIIDACTNSTISNEADQSCSSIRSSIISKWEALQKPDAKKFFMEMKKYSREVLKLFHAVDSNCNHEEIHAFLCLSNTKLIATCAAKIIQNINDLYGYEFCQQTIVKMKTFFMEIHQELSQMFESNTNEIEIF